MNVRESWILIKKLFWQIGFLYGRICFGNTAKLCERHIHWWKQTHSDIQGSREVNCRSRPVSSIYKKNKNPSIRKIDRLSRESAEEPNKREIRAYFNLLATIPGKHEHFYKHHKIYNRDESGFPLKNLPPKCVSAKGKREVASLDNTERVENVTAVDCFNCSWEVRSSEYHFKGVRNCPRPQDGPSPGRGVGMSNSECTNKDLFLNWLKHLQKFKSESKVLLIRNT